MDRTSDIIADGVAIAFDEDDAAKRDDTRIYGGMPLPGESAQSGMPFTAPVIGRVRRRSHVIGLRILAAEIGRIVQSIPDIFICHTGGLKSCLILQPADSICRTGAEDTVNDTGIVTVQKKLILQMDDSLSLGPFREDIVSCLRHIDFIQLRAGRAVHAARDGEPLLFLESRDRILGLPAIDAVCLPVKIAEAFQLPLDGLHITAAITDAIRLPARGHHRRRRPCADIPKRAVGHLIDRTGYRKSAGSLEILHRLHGISPIDTIDVAFERADGFQALLHIGDHISAIPFCIHDAPTIPIACAFGTSNGISGRIIGFAGRTQAFILLK